MTYKAPPHYENVSEIDLLIVRNGSFLSPRGARKSCRCTHFHCAEIVWFYRWKGIEANWNDSTHILMLQILCCAQRGCAAANWMYAAAKGCKAFRLTTDPTRSPWPTGPIAHGVKSSSLSAAIWGQSQRICSLSHVHAGDDAKPRLCSLYLKGPCPLTKILVTCDIFASNQLIVRRWAMSG